MPRLVKLYLVSVAFGFALATVFVALLVWFDVAGLGRLLAGSRAGLVAGGMLVFFNGIVFAGVQFGIALARMAETYATPPSGPLVPVPVVAGGGNRSSRGGVNFPRA